MAIECVSTLEIRLCETLESTFEQTTRDCIARLQDASGCLDYILTRSARDPGLWWLTAYWTSEKQMTESFESTPMEQLLYFLIGAGANLTFGSFVSAPAVAHGD